MRRKNLCLMHALVLTLLGAINLPVEAQNLGTLRQFNDAAIAASSDTRWQAIHWQSSMEAAKSAAYRERKPILVVMHNNFGGDTRSGEC